MLKKRLIGVVTVKNGWAVQSFGYRRYLPLGKPECLVENLDRWGADEIFVQVIDRAGKGPDHELLDKLARLGLGTPLIYGGGIGSVEDGMKVIQGGADRLSVDALLHDDPSVVIALGEQLGGQAIVASVPVIKGEHESEWFDYRHKTSVPFGDQLTDVIERGAVSEILLTDCQHEGMSRGFDTRLIDDFPNQDLPLIVFGGISCTEQILALLARPDVAAVSVGNFLNYREHAIQHVKDAVASASIRRSTYAAEYSLFAHD